MASTKSKSARFPTPLFIWTMIVLLFLFGIEIGVKIGLEITPQQNSVIEYVLIQKNTSSQIPTSKPNVNNKYICPKQAWIDCMPGPDKPKANCEPAFLKWAKANCPGFEGVAL
ncbi:hypothetical protein HGB07_09140 [Candidatus Roizmanbacteria bacterium]|nr:hypothetical protein [Candidatus Roizmanbacteria bacterium]